MKTVYQFQKKKLNFENHKGFSLFTNDRKAERRMKKIILLKAIQKMFT